MPKKPPRQPPPDPRSRRIPDHYGPVVAQALVNMALGRETWDPDVVLAEAEQVNREFDHWEQQDA